MAGSEIQTNQRKSEPELRPCLYLMSSQNESSCCLSIEGLESMYSNLLAGEQEGPFNDSVPVGPEPSVSYRPVTYISIPSLKVKMVVVLELLAPCFTSLMVS